MTLILGRDDDEWLLAGFRYVDGDLVLARVRVFGTAVDDLLTALERELVSSMHSAHVSPSHPLPLRSSTYPGNKPLGLTLLLAGALAK